MVVRTTWRCENRRDVALVVGLALFSGCYAGALTPDLPGHETESDSQGDTDHGGTEGGDDSGNPSGPPTSQCGAGDAVPGASPIRRLSAWEYENTIYDLLGDDSHPAESFPQEGGSGFDNNADVSAVSRSMAQKYMFASEEIAQRAVSNIDTLLSCDPTLDERECVEGWITRFGPQAWRRPLSDDEQARLVGLFDAQRAVEAFPIAVATVLQALLQSPNFLYRVELGIPGEEGASAVRLNGYEMASRLSYLLWGTTPDEELFEAAASDGLTSPAQIEAQARRMLDDPKARRMVEHFHEQWLGTIVLNTIDKDTAEFPEWSEALSARQADEAKAFVSHVFFEANGSMEELFTASYTFVDDELAAFYGLELPPGEGLRQVEAPTETPRSGILSLGGVMSAYAKATRTDPIKRGIYVREHLLCQTPPPPPDDVPLLPPVLDDNTTIREQLEQHRADPACSGCHELFDPLGFGLEHYDAVGRWRSMENDQAIDASGEIIGADVNGPFDGAVELGQRLAKSDYAAECMSRQWFRFAYGRTESEMLDSCNMNTLVERFAESGYNLQELLIALTQTDTFLYRTAYANEGAK